MIKLDDTSSELVQKEPHEHHTPHDRARAKKTILSFVVLVMLFFGGLGLSQAKSVDAFWGVGDAVESVVNSVIGQVGTRVDEAAGKSTLGSSLYSAKKGGSWQYGAGRASDKSVGVYGSETSPLKGKNFANSNAAQNNSYAFIGWADWASDQRLALSYVGSFNIINKIMRGVARFIGGALLFVGFFVSGVAGWIGSLVFKMLDVFNFFKYLKPNFDVESGWQTTSNAKWAQPLLDLFGGVRQLGFVIATVVLLVSVGLIFLVYRNQRGKKAKSTLNHFFLSIFAITGMVGMLSGSISWFSAFNSQVDDLGQNQAIGGLIFAYKDWVWAPYSTEYSKDDGKASAGRTANEFFMIPSRIKDPNTATNTLLGHKSSYILPTALTDHDDGTVGSRGFGAVSPAMIFAMNSYSGAISKKTLSHISSGTTSLSADKAKKAANTAFSSFMSGDYANMINSWMMNNDTGSKETGSVFGGKSGATAQYLTRADPISRSLSRQASDSAVSAYHYYDYVIPGGFTSIFRWLKSFAILFALSAFAIMVYTFIVTAIFDMWRNIIPRLPAAFALGSWSAILMIFVSVFVMMIDVIMGRVMISLFNSIINMPGIIFGNLFGGGSSNNTTGVSNGLIATDSLFTVVLIFLMFGALLKMYHKLGATFGELAADFIRKLSGNASASVTNRAATSLASTGSHNVTTKAKNLLSDKTANAIEDSSLAQFGGVMMQGGMSALKGAPGAMADVGKSAVNTARDMPDNLKNKAESLKNTAESLKNKFHKDDSNEDADSVNGVPTDSSVVGPSGVGKQTDADRSDNAVGNDAQSSAGQSTDSTKSVTDTDTDTDSAVTSAVGKQNDVSDNKKTDATQATKSVKPYNNKVAAWAGAKKAVRQTNSATASMNQANKLRSALNNPNKLEAMNQNDASANEMLTYARQEKPDKVNSKLQPSDTAGVESARQNAAQAAAITMTQIGAENGIDDPKSVMTSDNKKRLVKNSLVADGNGVTNGQKVVGLTAAVNADKSVTTAQKAVTSSKNHLDRLNTVTTTSMTESELDDHTKQVSKAKQQLTKATSVLEKAKTTQAQTYASVGKSTGIKLNANDSGVGAQAALLAATHAVAGQNVTVATGGTTTSKANTKGHTVNQETHRKQNVSITQNGAINSRLVTEFAQNTENQTIAKASTNRIASVQSINKYGEYDSNVGVVDGGRKLKLDAFKQVATKASTVSHSDFGNIGSIHNSSAGNLGNASKLNMSGGKSDNPINLDDIGPQK